MQTLDAKPRGILSVLFIGLILGPILLMLWLGRGRWALIYLAITFAVGIAVLVFESFGWVNATPISLFGSHAFFSLANLASSALLKLVGGIHGLMIRKSSTSRPWYRWIAVVPAWVVILFVPVWVAVPIFLLQPFNVPSASNVPSLKVGDYFLVSKSAYGYSRFSVPFNLVTFKGRTGNNHPQRGDMAVFKLPTNTKIDYVKRVIGLPADRIQMRDGVLFINGETVKKERVEDFVDLEGEGGGHPIQQYQETLPNGVTYRVLDEVPNGSADNTIEYVVPPEHYFMMGDNRDNSEDSRFLDAVGYVPEENFIGPVVLRYLTKRGFGLTSWPEENQPLN